MAFIILGDREQEWERRPLRQAITIGRSFDCDLPVRDTLLSRQHCRLEPLGNQWVLIDLKSRNGTRIGEHLITRKVMEDGDTIRIGQTRLCFRSGPFVQAAAPVRSPSRSRPIDPREAMAATMTGADLAAIDLDAALPGFPSPKPKPNEPSAFRNDGVSFLVSKIASDDWDSRRANQALSRRPTHVMPWPQKEVPVANEQAVSKDYAGKPARWLVMTYLAMAAGVFATSLCAIVWPHV